jgi:hypothetical protein
MPRYFKGCHFKIYLYHENVRSKKSSISADKRRVVYIIIALSLIKRAYSACVCYNIRFDLFRAVWKRPPAERIMLPSCELILACSPFWHCNMLAFMAW